jgi:hypothetical protein
MFWTKNIKQFVEKRFEGTFQEGTEEASENFDLRISTDMVLLIHRFQVGGGRTALARKTEIWEREEDQDTAGGRAKEGKGEGT